MYTIFLQCSLYESPFKFSPNFFANPIHYNRQANECSTSKELQAICICTLQAYTTNLRSESNLEPFCWPYSSTDTQFIILILISTKHAPNKKRPARIKLELDYANGSVQQLVNPYARGEPEGKMELCSAGRWKKLSANACQHSASTSTRQNTSR